MKPAVSFSPWTRFLTSTLLSGVGATCGLFFSTLVVGGESHAPLFVKMGLLSPIAIPVALLVACWTATVCDGEAGGLFTGLLSPKDRRFRLLLSGIAAVFAVWLVGQLAVRLLVAFDDRPRVGGMLLASAALGCCTFFAWAVDKLGSILSKRMGAPSAAFSTIGAFLTPLLLILGLIALGSTSGVGGPLALFGVLRREELDFSALLQLSIIVGCASLALLSVRRVRIRFAFIGGVLAAGVCAASFASARAMLPKDALSVERARDLTSAGLHFLQRFADSDGDGFSRSFGGGDCADDDPGISPSAMEIPDNGIDENCSGNDLARNSAAGTQTKEKPKLNVASIPENVNVLLLTIDTLRFDLGYSGHKRRDISPNLDQLASRSTVFTSAYSLASYTSKSLGPMMLGRYGSETDRTFEHFDRFSKDIPFLQERVQEAGLTTVSVQGYWYFFLKGYGFERGWDVLNIKAAPRVVAIEGDKTSNGDELADEAIEELKRLSDQKKRFFFWTHWVDPHAEYVKHKEFDYGDDSRDRYDGEVSFVDKQIGRVVDALKTFGLEDSTVVLVTSDHGEAFGEHGMIRHGFEVWEELVRVPLIVHVPGVEPRTVSQRRSLIDVFPTVLEALGIEAKEGPGQVPRGTSLLRDVLAPTDVKLDERPVLVDMPKGPHNQERRAFYSGSSKLVSSSGRILGLYDLAKDPNEKSDLSGDPEMLRPARDEMDRFIGELQQRRAR